MYPNHPNYPNMGVFRGGGGGFHGGGGFRASPAILRSFSSPTFITSWPSADWWGGWPFWGGGYWNWPGYGYGWWPYPVAPQYGRPAAPAARDACARLGRAISSNAPQDQIEQLRTQCQALIGGY